MTSFIRLGAGPGAIRSRSMIRFRASAPSLDAKWSRGVDPALVAQLVETTAELDSTTASLQDAMAELGSVPSLLAAAESNGRLAGRRAAFRAIQNARVIVNS